MKTFLVILILAIAGFVTFGHRHEIAPRPEEMTVSGEEQVAQQSAVTGFTWSAAAQESDPRDIFWSDVYLTVDHADATSEKKYIATVQGSCNELDADTRLALDSKLFQCYAAGFGDKFRVIESGDAYLVQRQEFQEASPEDTSPNPQFKTILTLQK
jgi:hypothetical protein